MSFPLVINIETPKDTDTVSEGAGQIRGIKSALADILGFSSGVAINNPLAGYDASKNAFVMSPVLGYSSSAVEGRIRYGGTEPEFYNGSQWIGLLTGTSSFTLSRKTIYKIQVATW